MNHFLNLSVFLTLDDPNSMVSFIRRPSSCAVRVWTGLEAHNTSFQIIDNEKSIKINDRAIEVDE